MLTPEEASEQLRALGVTVPFEEVLTIVLHLRSGGTQAHLYRPKVGMPLASHVTVYKIKKLLDAGHLDWMTDELARRKLLLDKMAEASDKDQSSAILRQVAGWVRHKDDGLGRFRLKIVEEAEETLKQKGWVWSVTNLERAGVPTRDALQILQEFDGLLMARNSSEGAVSEVAVVADGTLSRTYLESLGIPTSITMGTYMIKFRGFDRYLYLHHLVYLMQKYPTSPYDFASTATHLYTRGVMDVDESLQTAGEDILRYEIWRPGDQYLEAYYESLKRYRRTPKRNAELRGQIENLLKGNDLGNGYKERD